MTDRKSWKVTVEPRSTDPGVEDVGLRFEGEAAAALAQVAETMTVPRQAVVAELVLEALRARGHDLP